MKYNNLQSLDKITKIIKRGITPKYTNNKQINVINQRCIRNGIVNFEFVRFHDSNKKVQNEKYLQDYDVLVNSTGVGTLGRVAQFKKYDNKTYTVDSHVTIVRPIDEIDKLYFGYAIKEKEPFIASMGEGSTGQTELSRFRLGEEVFINVPSLDEQKKIALTLFSLDKKIEVNNKIIANLEEQALAIFKSWFVDFEPFQDGNFVESELGMIPERFKIVKLEDIYPLKSGYAFKSKDWTDRGFPIIKIKNINDGSIDFSDVDYVNNKNTLELASKFRVYGTEIVMALTGATTGKFGVVPYKSDAYVNQRVGLFFDKLDIGNGFLYGLLKQKSIIKNIIEMAQGSAQSNLSPRDVNNLKIIYCDKYKDIYKILNYFLEMVCKLLYQNKKLAEIRDALLPKLMSGEIDVSNIKIKGEEVKNE